MPDLPMTRFPPCLRGECRVSDYGDYGDFGDPVTLCLFLGPCPKLALKSGLIWINFTALLALSPSVSDHPITKSPDTPTPPYVIPLDPIRSQLIPEIGRGLQPQNGKRNGSTRCVCFLFDPTLAKILRESMDFGWVSDGPMNRSPDHPMFSVTRALR